MKKLILRDQEYKILQQVLRAVPVANLPRLLPDCNGGDIHYYRCLLTKVLRKNHFFPDTDDGAMEYQQKLNSGSIRKERTR